MEHSSARSGHAAQSAGSGGHGRSFAKDIAELALFLDLTEPPSPADHLEAAAAEADGTTLGSESRKISEAAEQLASRALSECAQRIELAARGRDFAAALQELQTLRREIAELQALTASPEYAG